MVYSRNFICQALLLLAIQSCSSYFVLGLTSQSIVTKIQGNPRTRVERSHDGSLPCLKVTTPLTQLSASKNGNNKGWFYRPSSDDTTKESAPVKQTKSTRLRLFNSDTDIKPKPDKKTVVQARSKKNTLKNASPLAELDDSPTTGLLDLENPRTIFSIAAVAGVTAVTAIAYSLGLTVDDILQGVKTLGTDPQTFLRQLVEGVQSLGPVGAVYYALIYMIAEILAIPATPLTLSAGYLFGVQQGIITVLAGATGAACIGFWISRTFLRDYVESTLLAPSADGSSNGLVKLDKAIGQEGFKLLILIRLSPIFPFSITNYLYGASSIDFGPYLLGTLIGFVPSTSAYVYTGMVGQALTMGQGGDQPWYVYAAGFGALAVLLKLITDVATGIIETIEDDA